MFQWDKAVFINEKNTALAEHYIYYGKFYKISNTFFSFYSQMFIIRTGIHEILVRITNGEDPDQTASSEAV